MHDDPRLWPDRPIDLTALDPLADPGQRRRVMRRLRRAAAAALARRRAQRGVWGCLAAWRQPVLATAGVVAAAAALVLLVIPRAVDASYTLAEAAGVPRAWGELAGNGQAPAPGDLLRLDGGWQ